MAFVLVRLSDSRKHDAVCADGGTVQAMPIDIWHRDRMVVCVVVPALLVADADRDLML